MSKKLDPFNEEVYTLETKRSQMTNASQMYSVKLDDCDWYELIMKEECPKSRAYAASFLYKKNLFVFCGCDLD